VLGGEWDDPDADVLGDASLHMEAGFKKIADEKIWKRLAKEKSLDNWDRDFFVEFRKLAEATGKVAWPPE
jgi:hypothetical protein